jgi:hypothetical protein
MFGLRKKKTETPTGVSELQSLREENARLKTELEVETHRAEKRGDFQYLPYSPEQIAAMISVCKSATKACRFLKEYGSTYNGEQLNKDLERLRMVGVEL